MLDSICVKVIVIVSTMVIDIDKHILSLVLLPLRARRCCFSERGSGLVDVSPVMFPETVKNDAKFPVDMARHQ